MRYNSANDGQVMRRASLGPAELLRRRRQPVTAPAQGRALRGFGIGVQEGVGAKAGAAQGAAAGASFGPWGAAIGAVVGAIAGSMNKKDPEDANFQQAQAMGQVNPQSVLNIANKYLVLAGLFDLQPSQIKGNIPIYKKYGRMGEQRFVTDMTQVVRNAALAGQISTNDTAQSIFQRIVQPWIDSFGYGPMTDSNAQMITYILMGMVAEYIIGMQTYWLDVNGGAPFASLPQFPMSSVIGIGGQSVAPAQTTSPVPTSSGVTYGPPPSNYVLEQSHATASDPYQGLYTDANGNLYSYASGTISLVQQAAPAPMSLPAPPVISQSTAVVPAASSAVQTTPAQAVSNAVQAVTQPAYSAPALYSQPAYSAPTQASLLPSSNSVEGVPSWAWIGGAALLAILLLGKMGHTK